VKRGNDGQCCCNCEHNKAINGHPWVTGTSIMTPTGMYVCDALTNLMASHKHGACEMWKPKKKA
jgi:hypothetical protein